MSFSSYFRDAASRSRSEAKGGTASSSCDKNFRSPQRDKRSPPILVTSSTARTKSISEKYLFAVPSPIERRSIRPRPHRSGATSASIPKMAFPLGTNKYPSEGRRSGSKNTWPYRSSHGTEY